MLLGANGVQARNSAWEGGGLYRYSTGEIASSIFLRGHGPYSLESILWMSKDTLTDDTEVGTAYLQAESEQWQV